MKTKILAITIFLVILTLSVSFFLTPAIATSDDSLVIVVSEEEESISASESDYANPTQEQNEEYENNEENENPYTGGNYELRDEEVEVFVEDENAQQGLSENASEDKEAEDDDEVRVYSGGEED